MAGTQLSSACPALTWATQLPPASGLALRGQIPLPAWLERRLFPPGGIRASAERRVFPNLCLRALGVLFPRGFPSLAAMERGH